MGSFGYHRISFLQNNPLLQNHHNAPADAYLAGLVSGGVIYLDCREYRHIRQHLDLSKSGDRMANGSNSETELMVPVNAFNLCFGFVNQQYPDTRG